MKQVSTKAHLGRTGVLIGMVGLCLAAVCQPALAAERTLAGIKIFSTTRTILAKYGTPSQVIVGRPSLSPTSGAAGATPAGQPGAPSIAPGALPGFGAAPSEFGGGAPGASPFGGATPGAPGQPGANGTTPDPSNGEVTWIYDRPGGSDLEFTMSSDGRVVQIRATGYQGSVRTAKGVGLGAKYGAVIGKYGYPETQDQTGSVLNAYYTERAHVAFQFYNQRVVAVIVAAVE